MARTEANLTSFSLTQLIEPNHWRNDGDALLEQLQDAETHAIASTLVDRLERVGWLVSDCYAIIHDKDIRTAWDMDGQMIMTEAKQPHIHVSFKFEKKQNEGATLGAIADALGVEPQFVEKSKSGRYSFDNQLAYLIHAKDGEKHQYDPTEVATVRGVDYMQIYAERKRAWRNGRAAKVRREEIQGVDWLEQEILAGKMTKETVILTDEFYKIYASNIRRIDMAFDLYAQRKIYKAIERLQNGEFHTKVYYIMGAPGAGKTRFSMELIRHIQDQAKHDTGEDWTCCRTASTNPVDDYNGEEILLMDDVRGSSMRADDWLKLLDPYNFSPSSARYRNKNVVARAIIITATMHPVEFFYYANEFKRGVGAEEAIDQFLRRLTALVEVISYDEVRMSSPERIASEIMYNITGRSGIRSNIKLVDSQDGLTRDEIKDYIVNQIVKGD